MKFWGIFRFELAYQLRRLTTWLFASALVVFAFLATRDDSLAEALYEDFYLNSPFSIAKTTVVATLIWLMVAAVVAGSAAARDVETRMHTLTFTAPVRTAELLGGRFTAAFALNALLLFAVQLGIVLAIYGPGVDPDGVGPFGAMAFLGAYAIISLPNAFAATALQFWLASRSRRAIAAYAGSFVLFFTGFVVAAILLYYQRVGSVLDPIGIRFIIEDLAHRWTPAERRVRLLALEGPVLWNRLLWIGVGVTALGLTYLRFERVHATGARCRWLTWRRRRAVGTERKSLTTKPIVVVEARQRFGLSTQLRQTFAIAWRSFRSIALSRAGLAIGVGVPALAFVVVLNEMAAGGVPRIPTTALVLTELTAPLTTQLNRWVVFPLLLLLFAGELVWRERDARLGDLTDAMPTSEWPLLLGKSIALGVLAAELMVLQALGGVLAQRNLGYHGADIGLYAKVLLGLQLPEYLLFAVLALVVHVIANQKYVGHLLGTVVYVFIAMPKLFGVEHSLLVYSAGPAWSYSEMRGFGASLAPWAWFKGYWAAWALMLLVLAALLSVRGRDGGFTLRLRMARQRLVGTTLAMAAMAVVFIVSLGGFIFYNTNVRNQYFTEAGYKALLADYERLYGQFKTVAQPKLSATRLRVEIYPEQRVLDVHGTYTLVNRRDAAIDSIHVATVPGAKTGPITFDRPATVILTDDVRGHRIFALAQALQPGDSLQLQFDVHVEPRGFGMGGDHESIVANGSFFTNADWLPSIGYQPRRELTSAADRRTLGLPPRRLVPSLTDSLTRMTASERTTLDVVVGTDSGQVAVAPGALRRTWTDGRRHYFEYSTESPIGNDYAFFSARYAVREARWNGVAIRVFYDPRHSANIERFARSIEAALESYTKRFGAYPYSHLSIVEVRGNELGMHTDAALVRFSEGTALWNPDGAGTLDLPFAVIAHEVAHEWWGHQLEPAYVEGGPVMGEGLAEFAALGVVKEALGDDQLRRLLAFMRQPFPYPPIRRGEPLLRGLDPYLAYRKAPFALRALSEYAGDSAVNHVLRRVLEVHAPGAVPRATTLDLYRELKTSMPDSLQALLGDLFERNTFWDYRVERASARQRGDSAWDVTLELHARKAQTDTTGAETDVSPDDWVDIGVFEAASDGKTRLSGALYLQKHRIRSATQTVTVRVSRKPALAGVDPFHVLDWEEREDDNNVARVKTGT